MKNSFGPHSKSKFRMLLPLLLPRLCLCGEYASESSGSLDFATTSLSLAARSSDGGQLLNVLPLGASSHPSVCLSPLERSSAATCFVGSSIHYLHRRDAQNFKCRPCVRMETVVMEQFLKPAPLLVRASFACACDYRY